MATVQNYFPICELPRKALVDILNENLVEDIESNISKESLIEAFELLDKESVYTTGFYVVWYEPASKDPDNMQGWLANLLDGDE